MIKLAYSTMLVNFLLNMSSSTKSQIKNANRFIS